LASLERKEGRGKDGARRDPRGRGGKLARQGKEEKEGGRERLTGGTQVSATAKEKEKERGRGPVRGGLGGLAGLAGPKGEQGTVSLFFFFKLLFKTTFLFKFKSNSFKLFSKIYKLCRNHTSNQKPCKPIDDAQSLVVSMFIKLCLIF
jgi:hypothetical protein